MNEKDEEKKVIELKKQAVRDFLAFLKDAKVGVPPLEESCADKKARYWKKNGPSNNPVAMLRDWEHGYVIIDGRNPVYRTEYNGFGRRIEVEVIPRGPLTCKPPQYDFYETMNILSRVCEESWKPTEGGLEKNLIQHEKNISH